MAKVAMVEREKKLRKQARKDARKRAELKARQKDLSLPPEERFEAGQLLAKMSRDGAKIRQRNRCNLTGRPRGYYRKFGISRIALREMALAGELPGVTKSSW